MTAIVVPYHLDDHLPDLDWPFAADREITADLPDGDTWSRLLPLYGLVADAVRDEALAGGRQIVCSGDCTTSLGILAGLQRAGLRPGVVWFDAHGDVQTLETTTSGYLGGMPLRMLLGYRPELVTAPLGIVPVAEADTVLVDARDLDPPEREFLADAAVRRSTVEALTADMLPDGPLYLHLDADVVTPGELPGLLYPAPGGPGLAAVAAAVGRVLGTGRVAAVGVGCTWRPGHGAGGSLAAAIDPVVRGW